jgi:hypothetical protein
MRQSKSVARVVFAHNRGYYVTDDGVLFSPSGRQLRIQWTGKYPAFSVKLNGKSRLTKIHQLAAYQRFGEAALSDGVEVRHLNGNRLDCSSTNIAIGSPHDNRMDMPAHVRQKSAAVAASKRRVFTPEQVRDLRVESAAGASRGTLAKKYGVAKSTVSLAARGIMYADV